MTSEMPRVVEGSQPTSDHAVLAVLPSMGVEGPGGGRAAAAGELEGPAGGRVAAAGDELAIRAGVAPRGHFQRTTLTKGVDSHSRIVVLNYYNCN